MKILRYSIYFYLFDKSKLVLIIFITYQLEIHNNLLITMRLLFCTGVLVLLVSSLSAPVEAWRTGSSRGAKVDKYNSQADYEGRGGKYSNNPKRMGSIPTNIPKPASRRGLGISAWGIIMVILTMILSGMGFYYFSMCYPLLCKKERNYDKIELDSV